MDDYRQKLTVSNVAVAECAPRLAQRDKLAWQGQECETTIVLIDRRAMYRECFSQYLSFAIAARVLAFASVEECLGDGADVCASLILLVHAQTHDPGQLNENIRRMTQRGNCAPLLVLSDLEDDECIDAILRCGVRGYISTNFTMDVVVKAVRLVSNGGMFAPTGALVETRTSPRDLTHRRDFSPARRVGAVTFTRRQAAVIAALRKGSANKTIAYELQMCESTVKVHVRNIMKKLNARSRTEVAYLVAREGL